ncbi:MAG: 3-deoxy-manno-octulosonate cytidylyltransferase [Parvibaculales bacterium]|nr:3-deoxy-manno-octulosonate cytidylyltransferase [Alphaproteobacteria bacterium]
MVGKNPIILIPARMASTRLPDKPLAQIGGLAMIVQVLKRAQEADCGRVVVAAAEAEIAEAVTAAGGEAVLTDPDLPSGSDRIHAALEMIDSAGAHDVIVNLQGDLPTLEAKLVRDCLAALDGADMATLVAEISDARERDNPNVVKAVLSLESGKKARALYFTRATAPYGDGPLYHHIGIYAYQRAALDKFVSLPPSPLEKRERLEQLRALEAGFTIHAAIVDTVPVGVDTPEDLAHAEAVLKEQSQ